MNRTVALGSLIALALATAGCQEATSPAPAASSAAPVATPAAPAEASVPAAELAVVQWGAKDAKVGTTFNEQPDGSSGLWFELNTELPPIAVAGTIGGKPLNGVVSSGKIVTATIPADYLATPGSYPIVLEVPSTGARVEVGEFVVTAE